MHKYIVRTSGPAEILVSRVGSSSWAIDSLPLNQPIKITAIKVRQPSADGRSWVAGTKLENVKISLKTVEQIIAEIKQEYRFDWHEFDSLGEARSFIETGATDHELLGVSRNATPTEIRKAYLARMLLAHPDKTNGSAKLAQALNAAYERISSNTAD